MRKLLAVALLLFAGPAFAADLRPGPVVVGKVPISVAPWTWSGLWVGLDAGAALSKNGVNSDELAVLGLPSTGTFHSNGLLIGGELDARYQNGGVVFGLDAIIDYANTKGGTGGCLLDGTKASVTCEAKDSLFGF